MNIGWLIQGHERYGVRTATLGMAAVAERVGVEPVFLSLSRGVFEEELESAGRPVVRVMSEASPNFSGGWRGRLLGAYRSWHYARSLGVELSRTVERYQLSAVHLVWPNLVWVAGPSLSRLGVPGLWEMPNVVGSAAGAWAYRTACRNWGIHPLPNSDFTRQTLLRGRQSSLPATVMHPPVDVQHWDASCVEAVERDRLGVPAEAPLLVLAARITGSKGQHLAIEALAEMEGEPHLMLLGNADDPLYNNELRTLASRLNVSEQVHWIGRVNDVERYVAAADVLLNTRVDPEPYGLTVVEAMSMARPVVAHSLGGPAETVVDEETGWLYGEPTVAALSAALARAMRDRPRWHEMGNAGRRRTEERYSFEAAAKRYRKVLEYLKLT